MFVLFFNLLKKQYFVLPNYIGTFSTLPWLQRMLGRGEEAAFPRGAGQQAPREPEEKAAVRQGKVGKRRPEKDLFGGKNPEKREKKSKKKDKNKKENKSNLEVRAVSSLTYSQLSEVRCWIS